MTEPVHTPDRLRALAAKAYRFGQSFNVPDLREVGDYLARSALAADEQGDILQQHAAAKAELGRLQNAVHEADAARIERDDALGKLAKANASISRWRSMADSLSRGNTELRAELEGQRLWYRLAVEWIEELRPLIPADKQTLIDPMKSASIASDAAMISRKLAHQLRKLRNWASLHAQSTLDPAAQADVAEADALLESDECHKFLPPTKSST